jgi:hypothetical protein
MRAQAAEGRTNAGILRGNLELVHTGIQQAEESVTMAEGQVATRRDRLDRPIPLWIGSRLIPALGWIAIALAAFGLVARFLARRK